METRHRIRTGIGGWTFEPWRGGNFYPEGLPQSQELHWASRRLPAIEINGTFYSSQKPATFAKWRDETPAGFMFSLKASRYCTHRRVLAEAGESVQRFVSSGIAELGEKLGPVVWQMMPTKAFDADDMDAFLKLLPRRQDGIALRHVLDVRHASFRDPAFIALARRHGCAVVFTDSDKFPSIADVTADFVYARLLMASADQPTGYDDRQLDHWADCARSWSQGHRPAGLDAVTEEDSAAPEGRDVFVYFINGAKERAPAAAGALLQRLGLAPLI
ncbi:DUF72 domain-containing protein [Xylophilus rhododendri]|uniref:DUF72 domain-containing protein n=1 Tax=Xylophilus rhododendri TaxID=2697032 RepID=A0A857J6F2_9BURK|nr:DUF72 domain-containing protein [Xylophilus rhododendri]QHI98813.1 DUF72 domain-containing protein [Xylophilus rhododendri]